MAEESVATTDRIEIRLDRLEQGQLALRQDVGELKTAVRQLGEAVARQGGIMEQLSQRIGNLEQMQRWSLGLWAALVLAVLGLYFKH